MKKVLQKYWAWAFVVIPLLLCLKFSSVPMFLAEPLQFLLITGQV